MNARDVVEELVPSELPIKLGDKLELTLIDGGLPAKISGTVVAHAPSPRGREVQDYGVGLDLKIEDVQFEDDGSPSAEYLVGLQDDKPQEPILEAGNGMLKLYSGEFVLEFKFRKIGGAAPVSIDPLWIVNYQFSGSNDGGAYLVNAPSKQEANRLVRAHYADQRDARLRAVSADTLEAYCARTETSKEDLLSGVRVPQPGEIESLWAGS